MRFLKPLFATKSYQVFIDSFLAIISTGLLTKNATILVLLYQYLASMRINKILILLGLASSAYAQVPACTSQQVAASGSSTFTITGGGGSFAAGSDQAIVWEKPPGTYLRRILANVTIVDTTTSSTFTPTDVTDVPVVFFANQTFTDLTGAIGITLPTDLPAGDNFVFRVTIRSLGADCYLDTSSFTIEAQTVSCTPGAMTCTAGLSGFQQCIETDTTATSFELGTVIPCAATTVCSQLTEGVISCSASSNQCTSGAAQCLNSTTTQICITDPNGINMWTDVPCAASETCNSSTGLCEASTVPGCSIGENQCADATSTQQCVFDMTSNENIFSDPISCLPGVCDSTTGVCISGPVEVCTLGANQCVGTTATQSCILDVTTNTNIWGSAVSCAGSTICDPTTGTCTGTAPVGDLCVEGETQCLDDSTSQLCVVDPNSGHTTWVSSTCPTGSSCNSQDGLCEGSLPPVCSVGATQCATATSSQLCILDPNTNLPDWSTATDCPSGSTCDSTTGLCTTAPVVGCTPFSQVCLTDTTFDECIQNSDGLWEMGGISLNCPSGSICVPYLDNTIQCVSSGMKRRRRRML